MRIAIVSTLARAQPIFRTWVEQHRLLGVERFYVFVDRAPEWDDYAQMEMAGVRLIIRDARLEHEWRQLPSWSLHQPYCQRQVYARQCLNTDYAVKLARDDGMDWLVHIDSDERLWSEQENFDLCGFFERHQQEDVINFRNHEAIPETWWVENYLTDITLFKRNWNFLSDAQRMQAIGLFGPHYFLAYSGTKAAINLHGRATESNGVHEFKPCERPLEQVEVSVLHYTYCGFNWYLDKFKTLGWFDDLWVGHGDILKMFPIMGDGRAAVTSGDFHEAARTYHQRIMTQGGLPSRLESLIDAGILFRIHLPLYKTI